jgi:hypothetical protein
MKIDANLYPNLALAAKFLPPVLAELENMMAAFVKKYQDDEALIRQFQELLESRKTESQPAAKADPVEATVSTTPTSSSLTTFYRIEDPVTAFRVLVLEAAAKQRLPDFYAEVTSLSNFEPGASPNRKIGCVLAQIKKRSRGKFVAAVLTCVPEKQHQQVLMQLSELFIQSGTTVTEAELRAEAQGK